ncbi:hypothetical protein ACIPZF_19005 [Pseudomonas sp. NPDC089752]|uniref:hypothetical protein n=1 Tax=Pseudomonas sp. NPDC089752 TaxID=3364472 RepID=UPI00381B5A57
MTFDKIKAEEKFDDFLMAMDGQLEWLEEEASKLGVALSISPDTPELLESLFDKMSTSMSKDDIAGLLVVFGRYLGEYVRTTFGGKWELSLDDPKNINFNTPVIVQHSKFEGLEFSPIRAIRAYHLRKKTGLIRQIVDEDVTPEIPDLSEELARENSTKGS